jgi:hypothetical protein
LFFLLLAEPLIAFFIPDTTTWLLLYCCSGITSDFYRIYFLWNRYGTHAGLQRCRRYQNAHMDQFLRFLGFSSAFRCLPLLRFRLGALRRFHRYSHRRKFDRAGVLVLFQEGEMEGDGSMMC